MDERELLSLDTADFGSETRRLALEAYERDDWYGIYAWAKSWISNGGGLGPRARVGSERLGATRPDP